MHQRKNFWQPSCLQLKISRLVCVNTATQAIIFMRRGNTPESRVFVIKYCQTSDAHILLIGKRLSFCLSCVHAGSGDNFILFIELESNSSSTYWNHSANSCVENGQHFFEEFSRSERHTGCNRRESQSVISLGDGLPHLL